MRFQVYYNDIEQFCVDWLDQLQRSMQIPEGRLDGRSIIDVTAEDVSVFGQCHFFAGIGGWSRAIRLSGFEHVRGLWTASLPCQPFSVAGKKRKQADERHLWPVFRTLVEQCGPAVIFGEQVASKAGREWFTGVRADLEELGYACGSADLCAAGIGAPHIRQRLYWGAVRMADTKHDSGRTEHGSEPRQWAMSPANDASECSGTCRMADTEDSDRRCRERGTEAGSWSHRERRIRSAGSGTDGWMVNLLGTGLEGHSRDVGDRDESGWLGQIPAGSVAASGAWTDSRIIDCLDRKKRRVGSGVQPLAHGIPRDLGFLQPDVRKLAKGARSNRKGRLKGYGNAIVPQLAALFIEEFFSSVHSVN